MHEEVFAAKGPRNHQNPPASVPGTEDSSKTVEPTEPSQEQKRAIQVPIADRSSDRQGTNRVPAENPGPNPLVFRTKEFGRLRCANVDQVAIGARTYGWYWSKMERFRLAYRGKSFVDLGCDVVEPGIVRIKKSLSCAARICLLHTNLHRSQLLADL
mmetsp:Transcript_2646/g.6237  ORF Transcript_2646/g.6237 Transcript_2646/m.6237 type:complete len:157 (+) Transcript_2646:175-645(+)